MKTNKNFLKKLTAGILGFVMTLGVGAAGYATAASETKAESTTITLSSSNYSNVSSGDITVAISQSSGSSNPAWQSTTSTLRLYASNTVTISSKGDNISKIEMVWTKNPKKSYANVTADVGTYTHAEQNQTSVWEGNNDEVVFTIGTGQIEISSFTVTTGGGGQQESTDSFTLLPSGGSTQQGFTISYTDGTTNSTDFRVYKNQSMTITSTVGKILKVELTYYSASYDGGGWDSSYTNNATTWTSPTASGEQARITKLVLTVEAASSNPNVTGVSFSEDSITVTAGDTTGENVTVVVSGDNVDNETFSLMVDDGLTVDKESVKNGDVVNIKANSGTSGSKIILISYDEDESIYGELEVNVEVPKVLNNITIKTPPTTTAYMAGDKFNPAGLVITLHYTGLTETDDVAYAGNENKFTFSPSLTTELATSNTSVSITYGGKSTTQTISVKSLSSIAVKTAPTKVSYVEQDKFAPTGLVITLKYSDNSETDVAYAGNESKFAFSPSLTTALATSNTSVSITYGGKSTTQAITVDAWVLERIEVSGVKTDFFIGDTFERGDNALVTAYYSNTTSTKEVTSSATFDSSEFDSSTASDSITIKVSYIENGTTKYSSYTVTVSAKPLNEYLYSNVNAYYYEGADNDHVGTLDSGTAYWDVDAFIATQEKSNSSNAVSLGFDEIRLYQKHIFKISPKYGYKVIQAYFVLDQGTGDSFGSLTNCTKEIDDDGDVKVIATDPTKEFSFSVTATVKVDYVSVRYVQAPISPLDHIVVSNVAGPYCVGDDFINPTVTAYYEDETFSDVSDAAEFSGYDMSTAGTQTVTASVTLGSVTKTTYFDITINNPILESIEVVEPKTEYGVNEGFTKPSVIAHYSNTTATNDVKDYVVFTGFDSSVASNSITITATYTLDGITKTDSFEISVIEKPLTITIGIDDINSFAGSYSTYDWADSSETISGKIYAMKNVSMQFGSGTGYIMNTVGVPGYITKIKLNNASGKTIRTMSLYLSNSVIGTQPSKGAITNGSDWVWEIDTSSDDNKFSYFYIKNTSGNAAYATSVEIEYKPIAKVPATNISLDDGSDINIDTYGYGLRDLHATVLPENAIDKEVTWSSSNTNVVTVENGHITVVGVGSSVITACTANYDSENPNPDLIKTVNVTVSQASYKKGNFTFTSTSEVSVTGDNPTLATGSVEAASKASFSNEHSGIQLTNNNYLTLSVSGYDNKKIVGMEIVASSNSTGGAGELSLSLAGTQKYSFSGSFSGAWASDYSTQNVLIYRDLTNIGDVDKSFIVGNDEDLSVYIKSSENSLYIHSISFRYVDTYAINYTSGSTTLSERYETGKSVTISDTTPPEGQKLDYWYDGSGNHYLAGSTIIMPSNDISLTAHFSNESYNVYFDNVADSSKHEYSSEIILPAGPTAPTGKEFAGWRCDIDNVLYSTGSSFEIPASDVHFTSEFSSLPYNVTPSVNHLTFTGNSTGTFGSKYNATLSPDDGYSLPTSIVVSSGSTVYSAGVDYTYDSSSGAIEIISMPASNVIIEASGVVINYTITYIDEMHVEVTNPVSYNVETETFELNNPSMLGYDFEGWYCGDTKITQIEKGTIGDITLTAHWKGIETTLGYEIGVNFTGLNINKFEFIFTGAYDCSNVSEFGFLISKDGEILSDCMSSQGTEGSGITKFVCKGEEAKCVAGVKTEKSNQIYYVTFYIIKDDVVYYSDMIAVSIDGYLTSDKFNIEDVTDPYAKIAIQVYIASLENNENQGE